MRLATLSGLGIAVAMGAFLALPATASARIVCNDEGDCWHSKTEYEYPAGVHIEVHPDDWKWRDSDHYAWREHEGRGYWHKRGWVEF